MRSVRPGRMMALSRAVMSFVVMFVISPWGVAMPSREFKIPDSVTPVASESSRDLMAWMTSTSSSSRTGLGLSWVITPVRLVSSFTSDICR
jgi:hypothetical protein